MQQDALPVKSSDIQKPAYNCIKRSCLKLYNRGLEEKNNSLLWTVDLKMLQILNQF